MSAAASWALFKIRRVSSPTALMSVSSSKDGWAARYSASRRASSSVDWRWCNATTSAATLTRNARTSSGSNPFRAGPKDCWAMVSADRDPSTLTMGGKRRTPARGSEGPLEVAGQDVVECMDERGEQRVEQLAERAGHVGLRYLDAWGRGGGWARRLGGGRDCVRHHRAGGGGGGRGG